MTLLLYSNNADTTLAAPITPASTSIQVAGGTGSLFPTPGLGQGFNVTLLQASNKSNLEIVLCTQRAGDTLTVARAQDKTAALPFNAGDLCSLRVTAGDMSNFVQPVTAQAQATNFAIDTGTKNAYRAFLNPKLTQRVIGMPLRFRALVANDGNCTLQDDLGVAGLIYLPGLQVPPGTIYAGAICEAFWDGTQYQLRAPPNLAPYALAQSVNSQIAAAVARTPIIITGGFNCTQGTVNVGFSPAFPTNCTSVQVQYEYVNPDSGWVVPGSRSRTGFAFYNGNGGFCTYTASGN